MSRFLLLTILCLFACESPTENTKETAEAEGRICIDRTGQEVKDSVEILSVLSKDGTLVWRECYYE